MNDKELLELAAKAAGIGGEYKSNGYEGWSGICKMDCVGIAPIQIWNPLTDDGDALRLAVKLQTPLMFSNEVSRCVWGNGLPQSCVEPVGTDPHAATRRAIVRAAAEIGRSMK